jgi:hypothetical protein
MAIHAPAMLMPKTAVNENHGLPAMEYQIRLAG